MSEELPVETVEEAERLTRLARRATDDDERAAYLAERADLLADHGFTARVREDDTRDVLVLHPGEWVEDGVIRVERIEDTDRAVERPLAGPGEADDWEAVDAHNRAAVAVVEDEHGPVHAANAEAFADFMGNHYARPVESATPGEREEFLTEYFPRNAWPSDEQRAVVEASVDLVMEAAAEQFDGGRADRG